MHWKKLQRQIRLWEELQQQAGTTLEELQDQAQLRGQLQVLM